MIGRARRRLAAWIAGLGLLLGAVVAQAHPLPNSLIVVKPGFGWVTLEIDTPAPDLAIAMRAEAPGAATGDPATVGRYYQKHVGLTDASGHRLPLAVTSARMIEAADPDVGRYSEWRVALTAQAPGSGSGRYTLTYDAVIHQIPNHFALVRVEAGEPGAARPSGDVGVVRYDFAAAAIHPLTIDLTTGSLASGFAAMIAVGFLHVIAGLDHILFLAALLMVAPFEAAGGAWRFHGMDRRALGRFAAISGAFTIGHSISLAAGAFGFDVIPARLTESLVAVSILVAAVHALRPLFPRREWLVAGGFGLIHGLAFSETLATMHLGLRGKIGALLGFNLGVELAQLAVLLVALPLLIVSGARRLARPRQVALLLIAVVATLWIAERAFSLRIPA